MQKTPSLAADKIAQSPTGPRIVFLDALRFVAAAAVVVQHGVEVQGDWGEVLVGFLSPGVFGVVLFFLVSGFVIPMTAKRGFKPKSFLIRRLFRIYPLVVATFFIVALTAYSGLFPAFDYIHAATLFDWTANILLVQDYTGALPIWGVTWTLSLEVAWYTLFALSLVVLGPRFDDWLSILAPVGLVALIAVSLLVEQRLPLGRLGMIYAAILGCRVYRSLNGTVAPRRLMTDLVVFLCVMAAANLVSFGYFRHPDITLNQSLYPWIAAPLLFSVVALVPSVRNSRIVNSKWIGWLGAISFSTYLLHPFALGISESLFPPGAALLPGVVLTLLFSVLGYYLVEVPGQKLGHWLDTAQTRRAQLT